VTTASDALIAEQGTELRKLDHDNRTLRAHLAQAQSQIRQMLEVGEAMEAHIEAWTRWAKVNKLAVCPKCNEVRPIEGFVCGADNMPACGDCSRDQIVVVSSLPEGLVRP